jgi:hypothetical protein
MMYEQIYRDIDMHLTWNIVEMMAISYIHVACP